MDQSFGSWMLTGGIRGEIHAEARQTQHLQALRELQSEHRAARRARRSAAVSSAVATLRTRFATGPARVEPDCCPA